jgi:proteasome accessory factor C
MPKMNSVFGTERLSLTYAVIGYALKHESVPVAKIAKHFGYREDEIVSILKALNVTEPGVDHVGYGVPFSVNMDLLDEGICNLSRRHVDLDTPRLTSRQAAALSTGLRLLQQVRGYRKNKDLDALIQALHQGSGSTASDKIQLEPERADEDLEPLRDAILEGKVVKFDYINLKGVKSKGRLVEPLRLISVDNDWYLKGFCLKSDDIRNFKLDAMSNLSTTDQDTNPDHLKMELDSVLYQPGSEAIDVVIEVEPEAYQVLTDYKASYDRSVKTGAIKATIKVTSLLTLPAMVASYGGAVRVLEPAEARQQVREFALRALGRGAEIIAEKTE